MRVVQVHSNTNRRTKMSNSLALRRRTFLNFGLLGAAVSAALPVKAFAQAPANVSFTLRQQIIQFALTLMKTPWVWVLVHRPLHATPSQKETVTLKQRLHSFTQSSVTCTTCRRIFSSWQTALRGDQSFVGCVFAFAESTAGYSGTDLRWRRALCKLI